MGNPLFNPVVANHVPPDPPLQERAPEPDRASFADPEKKALLAAVKEVNHLTGSVGTELVGVQLKDLSPQQKDELALLVAERGVVFFRDQCVRVLRPRSLLTARAETLRSSSRSTSSSIVRVCFCCCL